MDFHIDCCYATIKNSLQPATFDHQMMQHNSAARQAVENPSVGFVIMSSVSTLTLVGLHSTCRETGLPLGAHSVYKWSQCVTVHSVWALLSVGGLQPLVNISSVSSTVTRWINVILYIILHMYTHFLNQSITSTHRQLILYVHCISHHFHIHTVHLPSFRHTHSYLFSHTSTNSVSHAHTLTHTCTECWGVIIHGREMGMSNQRPAH